MPEIASDDFSSFPPPVFCSPLEPSQAACACMGFSFTFFKSVERLAFEPSFPAHAQEHGASLLKHISHLAQIVGKYQLTPSAEITTGGSYTASLSIRSGYGAGTHDRVFRFLPRFGTAAAAKHYAIEQGKSYVQQPALPA